MGSETGSMGALMLKQTVWSTCTCAAALSCSVHSYVTVGLAATPAVGHACWGGGVSSVGTAS